MQTVRSVKGRMKKAGSTGSDDNHFNRFVLVAARRTKSGFGGFILGQAEARVNALRSYILYR